MRKIIVQDGRLVSFDPDSALSVPIPFDPADPYRGIPEMEKNAYAYESLIFHMSQIEDLRKDRGKRHALINVLILTIFGILRGYTDFDNMAYDLKMDEEYFTRLLSLKHGIPSHDVFSAVFRMIDREQFMCMFINWIYSIAGIKGRHISIDGKALRAACDKVRAGKVPYVVNAFLTDCRIVIGQKMVDTKTNEIRGIPDLLGYLDIEGAVITIDAIGCQKEICDQIRAKNGHFVLPAKENQHNLHRSVEAYLDEAVRQKRREDEMIEKYKEKRIFDFPKPWNEVLDEYEEIEPKQDHGRREKRNYIVSSDTECVDREQWPHVKMIGMTIRERTVIKYDAEGNDISETTVERNTWIMSSEMTAKEFAQYVRGHWAIESSLHYVLDTTFSEDRSRARKDNAMENMAQMRRLCFNFTSLEPEVAGLSKTKVLSYFRHNPEAVINLIFNRIPETVGKEI